MVLLVNHSSNNNNNKPPIPCLEALERLHRRAQPVGLVRSLPCSPVMALLTFPSGTGAFGAPANTGASAFGAPKPATGFGAFGGGTSGGTGAFGGGGGGTFGTNTNAQPTGGGLFGQTNTNTGNVFGSAGGLFGNKPAGTSAFGSPGVYLFHQVTAISSLSDAGANPQAGQYDGVSPVTTGSSNPPYQVYSEKDGVNSTVTLQYQSISCMPQYRGTSFEVSHSY